MEVLKMKWMLGLAVCAGAAFANSAQAAVSLSVLGDSGSLRVTTYSPTQQTSVASFPSPYGTAAHTPIAVPVSGGWKIDFSLDAGFYALADNLSGGKTTVMSGKLDLLFTSDTKFALTANVFESGFWDAKGGGTVSAAGAVPSGIVVTEQDDSLSPESHSHPFAASDATYNADKTWSLYDQLTGFSKQYFTYKITIDNDLLAESLFNLNMTPGSAQIVKKEFSLVITTDGSSGGGPNTPEPASLGLLGVGGLALLSRRRRV